MTKEHRSKMLSEDKENIKKNGLCKVIFSIWNIYTQNPLGFHLYIAVIPLFENE